MTKIESLKKWVKAEQKRIDTSEARNNRALISKTITGLDFHAQHTLNMGASLAYAKVLKRLG